MGEIGTRLQNAREAQHISLRTAAKRLRINERYLEALEQEAFEVLPKGAYVLGFLRNYTAFLGLNYKEMRELYQLEQGPTQVVELEPKKRRRVGTGSSMVLTPGKVIAVFVAIASALLLWYLYNQYRVLTDPPLLSVFLPRNEEVYNVKQVSIVGRTDPDAVLYINGEEVSLDAEGGFERDYIAVKNGPALLEFVAKNRISERETRETRSFTVDLPESEVITVNKQGELSPDATAGTIGEDSSTPALTGANVATLGMVIRVVDRVWFSVQVDDEPLQEFILEKGQTKVLSAKEKIFVHSGKAYAAFISLNGGEEAVLGDASVAKRTYTTRDIL